MASGGIGEALAQLYADGTSAYDLSTFRPERFGRVDPADPCFRKRCAAARAGKVA
jgi:4-methylaminobutanoate oxidase (formaldehyde-forming)